MCSISSMITLRLHKLGFLKPLLPHHVFLTLLRHHILHFNRDTKLKNMLIRADCCCVIVH